MTMTPILRRLLLTSSLATLSPVAQGSSTAAASSAGMTTRGRTMTTLAATAASNWFPSQSHVPSSLVLRSLQIRGGSSDSSNVPPQYEVRSAPAPGSPFHYAFPVHNLQAAKDFYGTVLGCQEGRSSEKWQDFSLHGHQIVCHWVGDDYRCIDYYNPVDGDEVPVPHAGLALTVEQFHALADRLKQHGVHFIIEPHLRFQGMPGEQYTMFFKDPSGNNLEFKAMTKPENLFAKYNVVDQ